MPPERSRRKRVLRPASPLPKVEKQSPGQPEDPLLPFVTIYTDPEQEPEEGPARRAPRVVTSFTEEEKDLIIEFLQQHPVLYSKRLSGFKDTVAKENLWSEQARRMGYTTNELKTWYESMRTKLGKLKKVVTKSGQGVEFFTVTEK